MRKPGSMRGLEELGRVRLSANFFLRDFLYSEIANFHGIPNIPSDPDLAVAAGRRLSEGQRWIASRFEILPKQRPKRRLFSGSCRLCAQRQTLAHGHRYSHS